MVTRAIAWNLRRYGRLAVIGLAVASCSGGGGPTGPSSAGQSATVGQSTSAGQDVVVTLSNFRVRPRTGIYDKANAQILYEVRASDAAILIGGVARLRALTTSLSEAEDGGGLAAGQTPTDAQQFLTTVEIKAKDVIGDTIRVLMTVKLPLGRNRVAFSLFKDGVAQARQAGRSVQAARITTVPAEIAHVLKAGPRPPRCTLVLFGPVRPVYAALSLAFVMGLVLTQFVAHPRPRPPWHR